MTGCSRLSSASSYTSRRVGLNPDFRARYFWDSYRMRYLVSRIAASFFLEFLLTPMFHPPSVAALDPPSRCGIAVMPIFPRTGDSSAWNKFQAYDQFRMKRALPVPKRCRVISSSAVVTIGGETESWTIRLRIKVKASMQFGLSMQGLESLRTSQPLPQRYSNTLHTSPS